MLYFRYGEINITCKEMLKNIGKTKTTALKSEDPVQFLTVNELHLMEFKCSTKAVSLAREIELFEVLVGLHQSGNYLKS